MMHYYAFALMLMEAKNQNKWLIYLGILKKSHDKALSRNDDRELGALPAATHFTSALS